MTLTSLKSEPARKSYDVVIIGGAAVGSSTAYFLSKNPDFTGSVLVVERDPGYRFASTALSASSVRHQFSNAINVKMSQFASDFIRNFREHLGDPQAPDLSLKEHGYLFLSPPDRAHILHENHAVQKSCGAATLLLSPEEVGAQFPFFNLEGISLASWNPEGEGWFDGYGMMQTLRSHARANGVEYVTNEVTGISRAGDRVSEVMLAGGQSVSCGIIVNASGPRAAQTAGFAGLKIPVEPRKRCLFVFDCHTPIAGRMPLTIDPSGVFCRPEGAFYLTGTVPASDPAVAYDDFEVNYAEFEDLIWPVLANRIPQFEAIKMTSAWAGHYAYNVLDQNVVVGPHNEVGNFLFANGFSGHGLQQSPAIGRGLSEWITYGEYRALDLTPLGYERVVAGRPFLEQAII